jgi:hypothetical protein
LVESLVVADLQRAEMLSDEIREVDDLLAHPAALADRSGSGQASSAGRSSA